MSSLSISDTEHTARANKYETLLLKIIYSSIIKDENPNILPRSKAIYSLLSAYLHKLS
jgi:hypothetical protein